VVVASVTPPVNTLYIFWICDAPTHLLVSFRMFNYLGPEFMGLPLEPWVYCEDHQIFAINEEDMMRQGAFR
jgi:hypothetical protein